MNDIIFYNIVMEMTGLEENLIKESIKIKDLGIDSLDTVELFIEIENYFNVDLLNYHEKDFLKSTNIINDMTLIEILNIINHQT